MKTSNQIRSVEKTMVKLLHVSFRGKNCFIPKWTDIFPVIALFLLMIFLPCCSKSHDSTENGNGNTTPYEYNIEQAISDEAQLNTIAFDGLAFMTGNVGSQSFLPPGKVADYSGFQHLCDNDPTKLGHNTSFVTIIAFNVLHILNNDQVAMLIEEAEVQVDQINEFARDRYPLLKAFRRLIEGDLPAGKTRLSKEAVLTYTSGLYNLDGQISYGRARVFGNLVNSLNSVQKEQLTALKNLKGIDYWDSTLNNPLQGYNMPQDVTVAVMTYASEFYAWYAGSVTGAVYFCNGWIRIFWSESLLITDTG